MLLKRKYEKPEGWEPEYEGMAAFQTMLANAHLTDAQKEEMLATYKRTAAVMNAPPVVGVIVKHTGTHPEMNFKRQRVEEALAAGWMSISQGKLTLHAEDEDLVYTITRIPGTYCCHCDAKLDDDVRGDSGRRHVTTYHAGVASPDTSNPAGFLVTHAYECVLDAAQHAKWNGAAVAQQAAQSTNGTEPYTPKRTRKTAEKEENGA